MLWVAPLAKRLACQLDPAMAFQGPVLFGYSKMQGNGSAPLTQKMKQHERLFHAVGPEHADALLQEPPDEKQQALRLERLEHCRQRSGSK